MVDNLLASNSQTYWSVRILLNNDPDWNGRPTSVKHRLITVVIIVISNHFFTVPTTRTVNVQYKCPLSKQKLNPKIKTYLGKNVKIGDVE